MMTWPTPTFRCESCHQHNDYGVFGPEGWICIRCDMHGTYSRAAYLEAREGKKPMSQFRFFRGAVIACILGAVLWVVILWLVHLGIF